jgi:hypothetical protein
MKKIAIGIMAAWLSLTIFPLQASGSTTEPTTALTAPKPEDSAEAKALELRLNEINAMDKSELKSSDKKALRKEVKAINHKLREIGGGVYLSAGAIILILILLVIFL